MRKRNDGQKLAEKAVTQLLAFIGEDPHREGLLQTPRRVVKAFREMTIGYLENPQSILSTVFDEDCNELVLLRDVPFHSLCEHHLLPFSGVANVGYIPRGKVVGLSKLARLVLCYARRLQVQERLTSQIADSIHHYLRPLGTAVIVKATHQCMTCRGVRAHNTVTVTSAMRGVFLTETAARAEFLALLDR